jgi:hypothetical protein
MNLLNILGISILLLFVLGIVAWVLAATSKPSTAKLIAWEYVAICILMLAVDVFAVIKKAR